MDKELSNQKLQSFYHISVYEEEDEDEDEDEDLGQKLVGFVDCVSNGVTDTYIQDLMVHPDFQGKGLGTYTSL